MASSTHTSNLIFTTNAKQTVQQIGQVGQAAKKVSSQQAAGTKQAVASGKQAMKNVQALNKQQTTAGPKRTRDLKQQNKLLSDQNKLLAQQLTIVNRINAASKRGGRGGGPPPGGPPNRGGGGGGGGGFFSGFSDGWGTNQLASRAGLGRGLALGIRGGIGLAGMGIGMLGHAVVSSVGADYDAVQAYRKGLGNLAGLHKGGPFGAGLDKGGVDNLFGNMTEFGYQPDETVRYAKTFARATGGQDSLKHASLGMRLSKQTGADVSDIAGLMSTMRSGAGSFGEKGGRELQRVMQAAVKAGVDASTLPEYMQGVQQLTARAASSLGGKVSALPFARLLAFFEKSGMASLKGARGVETASKLDDMIKRPGGGEEGQAMMMAAMGFGGGASYYEARKKMQGGLSSNSLRDIIDSVDRTHGGPGEYSNLAIEALTNNSLSLSQIEDVRKAMQDGKTSEQIDEMLQEMTATELDVLKRIDGHLEDFLHTSVHGAKIQKKNIDQGEGYRTAIENMQNMLQTIFEAMSPVLAQSLKVMEKLAGFLTTGITELIAFLRDPMSYGIDENEETQLRDADRATTEASRIARLVESGEEVASEDIEAALQQARTAQQTMDHIYADPRNASALSMRGRVASDEADDARRAEISAQLEAARANARSRADIARSRFGPDAAEVPVVRAEVNIDQLAPALQSMGGIVPPGGRNTPDTTGGAP